jgi:hypothetical protein
VILKDCLVEGLNLLSVASTAAGESVSMTEAIRYFNATWIYDDLIVHIVHNLSAIIAFVDIIHSPAFYLKQR